MEGLARRDRCERPVVGGHVKETRGLLDELDGGHLLGVVRRSRRRVGRWWCPLRRPGLGLRKLGPVDSDLVRRRRLDAAHEEEARAASQGQREEGSQERPKGSAREAKKQPKRVP